SRNVTPGRPATCGSSYYWGAVRGADDGKRLFIRKQTAAPRGGSLRPTKAGARQNECTPRQGLIPTRLATIARSRPSTARYGILRAFRRLSDDSWSYGLGRG